MDNEDNVKESEKIPENIFTEFKDLEVPKTNWMPIIIIGAVALVPTIVSCIYTFCKCRCHVGISNTIVFIAIISIIIAFFLCYVLLKQAEKRRDFILEENKLRYALKRKLIEDIANRNIKLQEDAIKQKTHTKNESKEDDSKKQIEISSKIYVIEEQVKFMKNFIAYKDKHDEKNIETLVNQINKSITELKDLCQTSK